MYEFLKKLPINILYKILNSYFKNLVKKKLVKYLIEPSNIFVKTSINLPLVSVKIYNLEIMMPPFDNINITRFDIYQIIINIDLEKLNITKLVINGIKILYDILENNNENIFNSIDSFTNMQMKY